MTMTQMLLPSVAPRCSSSSGGMAHFFQCLVYPILEYCGSSMRHEIVKERNFRKHFGHGLRVFVDITRNSGGTGSALRGFSSGFKFHFAVQLSYASYATDAAAIEWDYLDTSTNIPEDVVIQPLLASLELVGVVDPLSTLKVQLTDEPRTLSHVSDLEAKMCYLRDWNLTDKKLAKLCLHVPSFVRSALLKNSTKNLVKVATFLVKECRVSKLKVAHALLRNVFLASNRIEDCLRPKVGLSLLLVESLVNITFQTGLVNHIFGPP